MSDEVWVEIGAVEIDSGKLLVIDPSCQLDGRYWMYDLVNAVLGSAIRPSKVFPVRSRRETYLGLVVDTAGRKGHFPVEARYVTDDLGKRRIAEIRARFDGPAA